MQKMSVLQVIVSFFTALSAGDSFDKLFPFKLALTALVRAEARTMSYHSDACKHMYKALYTLLRRVAHW